MKRIFLISLFLLTTQLHAQSFYMSYLDGWGVNQNILADTAAFNWSGMTYVVMFKIDPTMTAPYYRWDGWDAPTQSQQTVIRIAKRNGAKVTLCIGGVGGEWYNPTRDSATCQTIVSAIGAYARGIGYDGLTLDWESQVELEGFKLLSRLLNREVKNNLWNGQAGILTAAIGRSVSNAYDITHMNTYYDYLEIMSYDGNGWWSSRSGFHEPLYDASSNYPSGLGYEHYGATMHYGSNTWFTAGLSKAKTCLIFSTYVRTWALGSQSPPMTSPGQCVQWCTPAYTNGWEGIDYYEPIYNHIAAGRMTEYYDTLAKMAYASYASGSAYGYANYNNVRAIQEKVQYVQQNSIGGVGMFTIDQGAIVVNGRKTFPLMEAARLAINPPSNSAPSFTQQPSNTTVREGSTASFSSYTGGYPTPTYQWQKSTVVGGGTFANVSGATSNTYTTAATVFADSNFRFRCIATNSEGTATSNTAILSVTQTTTATLVSDDFSDSTASKSAWTFCNPSVIAFTGQGSRDAWIRFNVAAGADMWTGNKTAPRIWKKPTNIASGDFTVIIKAENIPTTVYTAVGIILKSGDTYIRNEINVGTNNLSIWCGWIRNDTSYQFSQPQISLNGVGYLKLQRSGNNFTISVSQDGSTYTNPTSYEWSGSLDSIGVMASSGLGAWTSDVDYFFNASSPISPEDSVVAGSVPPSITVQPSSAGVLPGASATFSVTATGTATLAYKWQKNTVDIVGATTSSYTLSNATYATNNGNSFRCIVSNSYGTVTSNAATLSVIVSAPTITTHPVSQTVAAGQSVTLSVVATGTPTLAYAWSKNGTPIGGATSASYTFTASSTGQYQVSVTNDYGTINSYAATLTVLPSGNPTVDGFSTLSATGNLVDSVARRANLLKITYSTTNADNVFVEFKRVGALVWAEPYGSMVVTSGTLPGDGVYRVRPYRNADWRLRVVGNGVTTYSDTVRVGVARR